MLLAGTACSPGDGVSVDEEGDLNHPRGLAMADDGRVLVAEVGGGRILAWEPGGDAEVLAEELPSSWDSGPGNNAVAGVSAVLPFRDGLAYVTGEFRGDRFRRLYALSDAGESTPITDVAPELSTGVLVNPFDIAVAGETIYISDSGANTIFAVDAAGDVRVHAAIPGVEVPVNGEPRTVDAVPTGIGTGPDGGLYVAHLTGAPFVAGTAFVLRVDPADGTSQEIVVDGLTAATDVVFNAQGWMLVAEFSLEMGELGETPTLEEARQHPGRILAFCGNEQVVVMEEAVTPTGIVAAGGQVFVSEEFAGRVAAIDLPEDTPLLEPCASWR